MRKLLLAVILLLPSLSFAQFTPWVGIVDPSRAVDWSTAGVVGGIPSATWTQCGSTVVAGTSAATINSLLSACASNTFLLLGPGSFNLSAGIGITHSNVVIRGSGANSTFLSFTGDSNSCGGLNAGIGMCGSNSSANAEQNVCDWSAGYSVGTTSLTLINCGSTTPAVGSATNLFVGNIVILDQLDEVSDTAWVWNCLVTGICSNGASGGAARTDGTCNGGTCNITNCSNGTVMCNRSQQQVVTITAVSGSGSSRTITVTPAIRMPNWSTGQKPQAWFANTIVTNVGVENLSIDNTSGSSGTWGILAFNASNCWVSGVRSLVAGRAHISFQDANHCTAQNNYFYQSQSHASRSYGVEDFTDGDNRTENSIFQQLTEPNPNNGGGTGDVFAYNFCIDDVYTVSAGWFQPCVNDHASGNAFNLSEGNIAGGYQADNVHGTHNFLTTFRNRWIGWQHLCDGIACNAQTVAAQDYASSRFFNHIGNVMGQTGYHNAYLVSATSSSAGTNGNTAIFTFGFTGNGGAHDGTITGFVNGCGGTGTNSWDLCTTSSTMLWGNYDTVNAANRFNCSEVPTGLAQFANACPASNTLPASFYLSGPPSFWQGEPWPLIGPDVTSGTLKRCSGGSMDGSLADNSASCPSGSLVADAGGHANASPAFQCALDIMNMPADGSGSALAFNPNTCYGISTVVTPTFSPVAGTYTSSQSVTISTTTTGATLCYTTDGSTPTANGAGTCTHGTTYSGPVTVATNLTLKAVGSLSGDTDSGVGSAAYVIAPLVATPTFSPVAGTYTGTQSVTISSSTGGATLCYTTDGSTPTANGAGTCTHGTTYSVPVSVASSLTLQAVGSLSGDTDSTVGSAAYTINPAVTVAPPAGLILQVN